MTNLNFHQNAPGQLHKPAGYISGLWATIRKIFKCNPFPRGASPSQVFHFHSTTFLKQSGAQPAEQGDRIMYALIYALHAWLVEH